VRHAGTIAKGLLPATVAVPAPGRALVLLAPLPATGPVPKPPALLAAVTLPPIVPDANPERPSALKARDLDEFDWIRARHAGGKADLDNDRCE